jgi:hypothetical protein
MVNLKEAEKRTRDFAESKDEQSLKITALNEQHVPEIHLLAQQLGLIAITEPDHVHTVTLHRASWQETVEQFTARIEAALAIEHACEEAVTDETRATVSGRELQRQGIALLNLEVCSLASGLGGKLLV